MMAIARHSRWMEVLNSVLHVTGGAAVNRRDPAGAGGRGRCSVLPLESSNAASLGAALRAWHAIESQSGRRVSWVDIVSPFVRVASAGPVQPRSDLRRVYDELMSGHALFEAESR